MKFTSSLPTPDCSSPTLPLRVLLVEDQAANRLALQYLLRHLSCEADAVANGQEALEILQDREYDVVLMDLMMPEMGGLEATRRLRMLPSKGARPRVIAITADDTPEDRESCREAGMDDYLAKPLTRGRLIQVLRPEALRGNSPEPGEVLH